TAIAMPLCGLSDNNCVIFMCLLHKTAFDGKQTLWTFLNKQNHKHQENNFCQYRTNANFQGGTANTQTKRCKDCTPHLTNTTNHYHKEGINNVVLTQIRPDITHLCQSTSGESCKT